MAKVHGSAGLPLGQDTPINVAVQRPTVNIKEAENVAEQAEAVAHTEPHPSFSKHATFGPKQVTHPGLED